MCISGRRGGRTMKKLVAVVFSLGLILTPSTKASIRASIRASMKTTIEVVDYKGWKNNLKLSNGESELVITLDVGPRIIRYGFRGGPNVFKEFDEQIGKSGEKEWMIRGGHRLWHAPEEVRRTYELDNSPVKWEKLN